MAAKKVVSKSIRSVEASTKKQAKPKPTRIGKLDVNIVKPKGPVKGGRGSSPLANNKLIAYYENPGTVTNFGKVSKGGVRIKGVHVGRPVVTPKGGRGRNPGTAQKYRGQAPKLPQGR